MRGDYIYDCAPKLMLFAHRYTGKERDTESGNDYFGARYYASSMGRFMSPDPLYLEMHRLSDPQQLNLYSYVPNNPLSLTDPDGRDIGGWPRSDRHEIGCPTSRF
jgi:RHS repeat-associated protein